MLKRFIIPLLFIVAVLPAVEGQVLDKPVATVRLTKLVNIGQRQLKQKAEQLELQLSRSLTAEDRKELLELEIGKTLIIQAVERDRMNPTVEEVAEAINQVKRGLGQDISDADFRRLITEQAGITYKEYEREIRERLSVDKYVLQNKREVFSNLKDPASREIQAFYEENATRFTNPQLVRFSHIFFDTRSAGASSKTAAKNRAEARYKTISNKQKTFEDILDESLDDVNISGGDFGYVARGDPQAEATLGKKFTEIIFSLDVGDVSTVLESNIGYHIVKITNKRAPKLLDIDDPVFPGDKITVREYIKDLLLKQKQSEAMADATQEIIDELLEEAEVRRFEDNLDW